MTLAEVAERAGITKQAVLRVESGVKSNPKVDTLLRIAKAVGKTIKMEPVDALLAFDVIGKAKCTTHLATHNAPLSLKTQRR
jgi:transcriptional regulator with XRE-family HTH domain